MAVMHKIKQSGGARPGAGRKSREDKGLPAVVNTTVQVEQKVIAAARENHGSLANALRFAAKYNRGISGQK